MFTNCPIDELLSAVEKAYSKFDKTKYYLKSPPTKILYTYWNASSKTMFSNLMGNYTKKIIGTAMGSVPSPEDCDILMFDILEEINNRFQFKHKIYCLLCSVFSKREIIYAPYFYLQNRNHVGSINEFWSKKRLSLIDRMTKHKN